jgi:hypothetical protein
MNNAPASLIVMSLLVALGLGAGGMFIGKGFADFRRNDRSVEVKGLAEKEVKADLGLWNLRYTATGNDLAVLLTKIDNDTKAITAFLKEKNGFKAEEIIPQRTEVVDLLAQQYRNQGAEQNRFIISGNLLVRSVDVDTMNKAASLTGDLAKQGVVLDSTNSSYNVPYYLFTKLNEIKPGMIAEATQKARDAAEQFAKDSGTHVGAIKHASQGLFSILPRNQTPSAEEAREITKTVRIVTSIEYSLGD